jgi:hypothetical protein
MRLAHRAALALLLAQSALLAAWPLLEGTAVRAALAPCYSATCNQKPERCYVHGGEPMPLCARCLGVWLGLLLASALAVAGAGGRLWTVGVGAALFGWMVASWALGRWLPASWHLERTLAGVAGGVGAYVLTTRLVRTGMRWAAARVGGRGCGRACASGSAGASPSLVTPRPGGRVS